MKEELCLVRQMNKEKSMKVYVVWEYAVIEYEECFRNMGVFSSEEKAKEAVKE